MAFDVFIAHAAGDHDSALRLFRILDQKYRVFLASESLIPGDAWNREIAKAQRESGMTLVLVSTSTNAAFYEQEEIASAIALSRDPAHSHRVVPLYLGGEMPADVPYGLRQLHSIVQSGSGLRDVGSKIRELLKRLGIETRDRVHKVEKGRLSKGSETSSRRQPVQRSVAIPKMKGSPSTEREHEPRATRPKVLAKHDVPAKPAGDPQAGASDVLERWGVAKLRRILRPLLRDRQPSLLLALIDIDNQTAINRTYGVTAGDEILRIMFRLVKANIHGGQTGRLGADSFFAIWKDGNASSVRDSMRQWCGIVSSYEWEQLAGGLFVTCSVGVAESQRYEGATELIARAGHGVRRAKADGGNRVAFGPRFLEGRARSLQIS